MVSFSGIEAIERSRNVFFFFFLNIFNNNEKHTRTSTAYKIMQRTVKPNVFFFLHSLLPHFVAVIRHLQLAGEFHVYDRLNYNHVYVCALDFFLRMHKNVLIMIIIY